LEKEVFYKTKTERLALSPRGSIFKDVPTAILRKVAIFLGIVYAGGPRKNPMEELFLLESDSRQIKRLASFWNFFVSPLVWTFSLVCSAVKGDIFQVRHYAIKFYLCDTFTVP